MVSYDHGANFNSQIDRINSETSAGTFGSITKLDAGSQQLEIWNCRIKEHIIDITGDNFFIVEHPDYGTIGDSVITYNNSNDYIIDTKISNAHNLFFEQVDNTRFMDSEVTSTKINLINHEIIFDNIDRDGFPTEWGEWGDPTLV